MYVNIDNTENQKRENMRRKSRGRNTDSENIIKLKGQLQFNQICKELDYLRTKIKSHKSAQKEWNPSVER